MYTNSGAPYEIERTLSARGGFGRGWIVTHRRTQTGALKTSLEAACRWMDSDAAYRRAREQREADKDTAQLLMATGLEAVKRLTLRDLSPDLDELPPDLHPYVLAAHERLAVEA